MRSRAFEQDRAVGELAARAGRLLQQLLAERLAPLGIAPAQLSVLLELARQDGQTQRELLERLDVEQGTMTRTLQRMARDGLIQRRLHEQDARAARVFLSARARRVLGPAREAAATTHREALTGLSGRERALLTDLLRRVLDAAHARRARP